jgi:hypothetical protein
MTTGAGSIRNLFFCVVAGLLLWAIGTEQQHRSKPPGIVAPSEPAQFGATSLPWKMGVCELRPLASIRVHARVLSTERYWFDRGAALSPVDLALGWGAMSDGSVLDRISISQGGRWYTLRPKNGTFPMPVAAILEKSANMHMIPATQQLRKVLLDVRTGDVIRFSGSLVEVSWPDGGRWRSSLRRTDTGEGSCELVWVEDLAVDPEREKAGLLRSRRGHW